MISSFLFFVSKQSVWLRCICMGLLLGAGLHARGAFEGEEDVKENLPVQKAAQPSHANLEYVKQQRLRSNIKKLSALKQKKPINEGVLTALIQQILNDDPDHEDALNTLGSFYLEKGWPQIAKILYVRALKAHPKNSSLHNNLAVTALKKGEREEAVAHFRKSLSYRYSNYSAAANLGALYMTAYEYDLSLDYMKMAYNRVRSYLPKGHPDAIKIGNNYAVALAWNKNFQKSQSILQDITRLRPLPPLVLLNYAILMGKDLKNIKPAFMLLRRADLLNKSGNYTKQIKAVRSYLEQQQARPKQRSAGRAGRKK